VARTVSANKVTDLRKGHRGGKKKWPAVEAGTSWETGKRKKGKLRLKLLDFDVKETRN